MAIESVLEFERSERKRTHVPSEVRTSSMYKGLSWRGVLRSNFFAPTDAPIIEQRPGLSDSMCQIRDTFRVLTTCE